MNRYAKQALSKRASSPAIRRIRWVSDVGATGRLNEKINVRQLTNTASKAEILSVEKLSSHKVLNCKRWK